MTERKRSIGVKEGACWRTRDKKAKKFAADFVDDIIAEEEEEELTNAPSNTKEPILNITTTIQQEEESLLAFPESQLVSLFIINTKKRITRSLYMSIIHFKF